MFYQKDETMKLLQQEQQGTMLSTGTVGHELNKLSLQNVHIWPSDDHCIFPPKYNIFSTEAAYTGEYRVMRLTQAITRK